jgi:hypothetical protein
VSVKPIEKPDTPHKEASPSEWKQYHEQMVAYMDWRIAVEEWRGGVETRLESIEALIPDILERLPAPTITPEHQNQVKYYVAQLVQLTKKPYAVIYSSLYTAFKVPRYTELQEDEWSQIDCWFRTQLKQARSQ